VELEQQLADLVATLEEFGLLPLRAQRIGDALPSLSALLRKTGLPVQRDVPRVLDEVLCRRNEAICETQRDVRDPNRWAISAGSVVSLPDIDIEFKTGVVEYRRKQGDSIEEVATSGLGGCESFDSACQHLVERLNRHTLYQLLESRAAILLPLQTATVRLRGPGDWPNRLLQRLKGHIASNISVQLLSDGVAADTFFRSEQLEVFTAINHPFALGSEVTVTGKTPVVAVVDLQFAFEGHCDFEAAPSGPCHDERSPEAVEFESHHGTHIAGVIGAQRNGRGIVGVNPTARVKGYAVSRTVTTVTALEQAINAAGKEADVLNFSFRYKLDAPRDRDLAKEAIKALSLAALIVAAAGNDGKDLTDDICDIRPACLGRSLPNVVSVVALDKNMSAPALWPNSNRGAEHFDLAAPGEHILSTISDNSFAFMSGTSNAAPFVAGAASLLFGKYPRLTPAQVKRRLIYASDLLPNLAGKVLGGRLNIGLALDCENDLLRIAGETAYRRGKILNPSWILYFQNPERKSDKDQISMRDVLRLTQVPSRGFSMLTLGKKERIERADGIRPLRAGIRLQFQESDGEILEISDPTKISDFVAGLVK